MACTVPAPTADTAHPTPEPGVLRIDALLDLSGRHAAIGTSERDALQVWLDDHKGKTPFPVRIRSVDTAGSDAKLFVDLRHAAVDDAAAAVIVGTPVTYSGVLGRALDVAALPVLFTEPLPGDPGASVGGRWAFGLAPTLTELAAANVTDAQRRGTLEPGLVLIDPKPTLDPLADALEADLSARGLADLPRVRLSDDGAVPASLRSDLLGVAGVQCTVAASACDAAAREAQAVRSPALFYLSYLTTQNDLSSHRGLAARAIWPSSRTILPFEAPPVMPINQVRYAFLREYASRYGPAGVHAATAYDAASLLSAAAERARSTERMPLRDALEGITMSLIATTYSFAPARHAGSDPDDLVFVRWNGSALATAPPASGGDQLATPTPSPRPRATKAPSPSPSP